MKRKNWLSALLIMTFLTLGLAEGFAQTSAQGAALPDSMLTTAKALDMGFKDRELALRIVGEIRRRGLASDYEADKTEAAIRYNAMQFAEALDIYDGLLSNRDVKDDALKMMDLLESLANVHDVLGNTSEKLDYINRLMELAQQHDNRYYHSVALFLLGKTLYYDGKRDKGVATVRQAIDLMEQADSPYRIHLLHSQLNVLASMLADTGHADEALQAMERNEQVLRSETPVNIDNLMVLLAKKADKLVLLGRTAEADSVYNEWKAMPKNPDNPRTYFIIDYLRNRGRYAEAMAIYERRLSQQRATGDTTNLMTYIMKWGMAETAYGLHRYQQAADLYLDVVNIGDSLQQQAAASRAQEIETIYRTHEKEQKIAEQRFWLGLLTAVVILLLLALGLWWRYSSTIRRKNRAMVQTINELMTYRELALQQQTASEGDNATTEADASERSAFLDFDGKVNKERLFCNPDFDRDQLIRVSGIEKNRLTAIIRQFTGTNIPGYINSKRVEHAVALMKQHPDYTLVAIAEECGFVSQTTFIRVFRNTFGMTPSEYKSTKILPPPFESEE